MSPLVDLGAWDPTRLVLHQALRVLSRLPYHFAPREERWGQISFKVRTGGLWLDRFPLPDGRLVGLGVRVPELRAVLQAGEDPELSWPIADGPPALAQQVFQEAEKLGLAGLDPGNFNGFANAVLDPAAALRYFDMIVELDRLFERRRSELPGDCGPVQIWPHNFDMAFEWYADRTVETDSGPARPQVSLGWAPGDESHPAPYFYSNPWPFDPELAEKPLPEGAYWMTGPWKGSLLPYSNVIDDPGGEERVLAYARAVFRLAGFSAV